MRVVNLRNEAYTIYIGRYAKRRNENGHKGSGRYLGNPFLIQGKGTDADRLACVLRYFKFAVEDENELRRIWLLPADSVLGCFCKPKICHGDVIVGIWEELHESFIDVTKKGILDV